MEKVVRKFFIQTSADKEEKWLNDMARKGYLLKSATLGKYTFSQTDKKYKIRLAYLPKDKKDFIHFIEEGDVQNIAEVGNWGYFVKEVNSFDDNFEIYSDIDSKIEQKNRVLKFLGIMFLCTLPPFFATASPIILNGTISDTLKIVIFIFYAIVILLYVFMILKLFNQIKKLKQERDIQE
ncbi:DUF2812 domain-containing protein [Macrococcoides canis]|uniref:DUF2812 domain-containing protein n=1 Tax=Macrococcoides canis TaxID=1855823 RepID=UPI0020B7E3E7|nr:DUF2812 domain-containing protein [Macrococcus canis]UTH08623.1 DUF2812 domain-containing protein [Macrococcus canis]